MGLDKFKKKVAVEKALDLDEFTEMIGNFFKEVTDIDIEAEEIEDGVRILAKDLQLSGLDDNILAKIVAYTSGCIHVCFIMDELEPNEKNYENINNLNNQNSFLCGYINVDGYFEVHYGQIGTDIDTEGLYGVFEYVMDAFSSDEYIELLKPICAETK